MQYRLLQLEQSSSKLPNNHLTWPENHFLLTFIESILPKSKGLLSRVVRDGVFKHGGSSKQSLEIFIFNYFMAVLPQLN
jgi:hypothetical protein